MEKEQIKQELKNLGEEPVAIPKKEDDKVLVDKKFLSDLMGRIDKLEQGVVTTTPVDEPKKARTVKVRFLNDKVVVGYGKTFEKKDIDGRRYLILQVTTEDRQTNEVEYLPFMNQGIFEEAEIVDIKKDYIEDVEGKIYQTEYDYKNFKSVVTDKLVDMKVTIPDFKYTVKLKNGREITLPERALN